MSVSDAGDRSTLMMAIRSPAFFRTHSLEAGMDVQDWAFGFVSVV